MLSDLPRQSKCSGGGPNEKPCDNPNASEKPGPRRGILLSECVQGIKTSGPSLKRTLERLLDWGVPGGGVVSRGGGGVRVTNKMAITYP